MSKPKIASDWMCGCAGCHMSLLDMDERILKVVELADLRSTPITDLKEPDASGVDVGILEGGINNTAINFCKRFDCTIGTTMSGNMDQRIRYGICCIWR